ncbi:MAG: GSCFA domain-containing protein, partial [Phycisphaerales bacterium]|nr:GSCFA domain-containing protein [Phycisphaerales bacterium]
ALGKSILRSALHEAITSFDGGSIDYFPSYEIVTAQRGDHVYMHERDGKPDGHHIRDEFIGEAVRPVFESGYLSKTPGEKAASRRDVA